MATPDQTSGRQARRPLFSAFGVSVTAHIGLFVCMLAFLSMKPDQVDSKVPPLRTDLVYLQSVGATGGGGGSSVQARRAPIEIPQHQPPAAAPLVTPAEIPPPVEKPLPVFDAPIVTANAVILQGGGTSLTAPPGPGGTGKGDRGIGPGDGDGLDGKLRGVGGGPPGSGGATPPDVIRQVKPEYTGAALQAKVQGSVTLEVEVLANGTVGSVKILKSLDRSHGLDAEAVRTVRKWLFRPGTLNGKPVDMLVQVILDFNLR